MSQSVLDKSQFLNVDLDVISNSDLKPLVEAMEDRIIVLYVGRVKRHYEAHLELVGSPLPSAMHLKNPEMLILGFCRLIQGLPLQARKLWDSAKTRSFDIGIEARGPMHYYWFALTPKAIEAALEINAQIAVTVYGTLKRTKAPSKPRKVKSSK
jgi:hypothetical protein